MKIFIAFFIMASVWNLHAASLTSKDVSTFTLDQKVKVIEAYREFFREYKTSLTTSHQSEFLQHLNFISDAYASGDFNCFYAGWPSKTVNGKCTNPSRTNTSYVAEASNASCSSSQLMCNPILFGRPGICVNTSTQVLRNSAYTQCERNFSTQSRTIESVASSLNSDDLPYQADEMYRLADQICATGFQSGTRMCSNLKNKLNALRAETQNAPASGQAERAARVEQPQNSETQAPVARRPRATSAPREISPILSNGPRNYNEIVAEEVTRALENGFTPEVLCDPTTGLPLAVDERGVPVFNGPPPKAFCPSPASVAPGYRSTKRMSDFTEYLNRNNITVLGNITNMAYLETLQTMSERFPTNLMNELLANGAKINVFEGTGVTADPTFDLASAEAGSAYQLRRRLARENPLLYPNGVENWSQITGSGGSVTPPHNVPMRLAINHLEDGGTENVFLHEHAHTLDSLYKHAPISSSNAWSLVSNSENARKYFHLICKNYCVLNPGEAFAESFAAYHGCDATRQEMEREVPEIAEFFKNLTSVRELVNRESNQATPRPQ